MSVARDVTRTRTRETPSQKEALRAASLEIGELRPPEELVARLGVKPSLQIARVGSVTGYDKPLQDVAGNLSTSSLRLPLRLAERKHMVILAWVLEPVDPGSLMRALVRSAHPDGSIWVVTYRKEFERPGVPAWDELLRAGLGAGWVDTKILPFGSMLQAVRFNERRPGARSVSGGIRGKPHP